MILWIALSTAGMQTWDNTPGAEASKVTQVSMVHTITYGALV